MNTINPLIPFDMVVDTDVGLIKIIDKKYHDTDTFYTAMLSSPVKPLIYNLIKRENSNPLSIVLKDTSDMDSLYEQFMKEEYSDIVGNSVTTDIFSAIKLFIKSGTVVPTILCKNEIEMNTIEKIKIDNKSIQCTMGSLKDQDMDLYDAIYLKHYRDILPAAGKVSGKNLYVADYKFNMERTRNNNIVPKLLFDISILVADVNTVKIIEMYNIDDSFIAKG